MFLSDLSIKQPVFATMMMAALAVLGLTSYQALKVDLFPDVEFPVVTVTTRYTGASPETVERDVTKFIEEAVNTVEGVRHIESTSQEGLSSIVVQFNVGVPTLNASQDIRGKVAAIRGELPREIDEPIILRIDPASTPIVSVAVNAPTLTPRAVSDIADKLVKRRLENVPGVGAVNLVGEAKREIQVVVDRTRLESYGLSLVQVVDALRTQNVDAPVGTADRGATEAMVRVAARGTSAAQIADIPVKQLGNRTILVRDVAQVIDGVEEATSVAFVNERPAIALDVQKQAGANTVGVADGVREAVAKMQPELPPGVSLQMVRDDSTFIRESIEDVQVTLVLGGLLTVFIVFLFLNSWRSTVITGLTLPISVIAAFIAMRMFGFTLNVLTLMGLSLAIGMLIDDAIVVRENIVRHMQKGKDHLEAAREGTAEIGLAVMATTFTIIAVFIPVAFMGGMVGQFFYEFGITVAAAVLVSLFVSFTLDPDAVVALVRPGRRRTSAARLRRPHAAGLQPPVRQPARLVRADARLVAAAPVGGLGGRARGVRQRVPDSRDARRRLHARLQPRRVSGRVQGDAGRDAQRDGRSRAGGRLRSCASCRTSNTPTRRSAKPARSIGRSPKARST